MSEFNPPGLFALAYRVSDYTTAKQRILESLYVPILPEKVTLAALKTRDRDDLTIALIDAWAMVIDVLTFYQERIANEGFWRTATERRSLFELAQMLGCELTPGVAASTYLAFTVETTPNAPKEVTVMPGTAIASIPGENEQSQTFETREPLIARADWNALIPRRSRPQKITPQTTQLYLEGLSLQLQRGDYLLLIDQSSSEYKYLLKLTAVDVLTAQQQTRITWEPQVLGVGSPRQPQLFAFRQRAALFGNNAPKWETLPDEIKRDYSTLQGGCFSLSEGRWTSISTGLPTIDVWSLATSEDAIFAGTNNRGIFRSRDRGKSWQASTIGLTNLAITTLYYHAGSIFAGSPSGGVFCSKDNGETWTAIGTGNIRVQSTAGPPQQIQTVNTGLPNTIVRTVLISENLLYVGTDHGVYSSNDQGQNWQKHSSLTASVRSLVVHNATLYAGTDQGIFYYQNENENKAWHLMDVNLFVNSLVTIQIDEPPSLFAGTKTGVYQLQGETWGQTEFTENTNSLVAHETTLYAATTSGKVYLSSDSGVSWAELDPGAIATEVTALTFFQANLIAGTRFAGFTATDWSRSGQRLGESTEIQGLNLNAVYPQILPNSWLVLLNQEKSQPVLVEGVKTAIARGFTLEATVSHIAVSTDFDDFLPQTTTVFAQSEALALANLPLNLDPEHRSILEQFQDPIDKDHVYLEQFVPGLQAGQNVIVTGKRPRVQIHQVGGIFQRQQSAWAHHNQGLTNIKVLALTVTSEGNYFAGTEQGLFQRNNAQRWDSIDMSHRPESGISANLEVRLLCTVPAQTPDPETVFAGTEAGLLRSIDQGKTWITLKPLTQIRAIAYSNASHNLFVATETSLFLSTNNGEAWTALDRDLLGVQVQALAIDRNGVVFAGTRAHGIYRSTDKGEILSNEGKAWEWVGYSGRSGMGAIASIDNLVTGTGTLFSEQIKPGDSLIAMGQTRKVIALAQDHPNTSLMVDEAFDAPGLPEGTPFTLSTGLSNLNVTALAIDEQPGRETMIFAGTAGGGILRSHDFGNHWEPVNQNLDSFEIKTLVAYAHPGVGYIELYGTTLRVILTLLESINFGKGSAIVIGHETRIVTTSPQKVYSDDELVIQEFTINSEFTSETSALETYTIPTLVAGTTLGGLFYSQDRGETWTSDNSGLTNTAIRAILPPTKPQADYLVGGIGILLSPDRRTYTTLSSGDSLQVLACPISKNNTLKWHLLDVNQFTGILTTTEPEDLSVQPALSEDESNSELATLLTPLVDQQTPILTFQERLQNCYDPSTVTVHANVVAATHGETIADIIEVLGSGDGNLANQTFVLQKAPLTYIPDQNGIANTLQIRVNDLLWREVPALYRLKPDDQVYIVRIADDGTTTITFGDGINGARLPSGVDNVVATYRSGLGVNGNVAANKLSLLKTRSLGIQSVTNLLPATGGANPETRDQIRDRAPLTIRTLDRIVSIHDFEDFTRTFPGIGKAQAVTLWSAQTQVMHLTIAGYDGADIPKDSALYESLVQSIEQRRDFYQFPPLIESYERLEFDLEATVLIDDRYLPEQLKPTIEAKLQQAFAFVDRDFGQSVTAAEIIALIQSIPGVIAVDLDALYRVDRPKTLEQSLTASLAQWTPTNQFTPAQLLLLHTAKLTIQSVS